jgi:hypothetical protein
VDKRKGRTHVRACLASPGGAWAMGLSCITCQNSSVKSSPEPNEGMTSFSYFALFYFASWPSLTHIEIWKPSWLWDDSTLAVHPIYTCDSWPQKATQNKSLGFCLVLMLCCHYNLLNFDRVHQRTTREQVSRIIIFNDHAPGEWLRFLRSILHNCSIFLDSL